MTETQKKSLVQFANNGIMYQAVFETLLNSFLIKRSGEDTEAKAARFVAVELLKEAFKEIDGYKTENVVKSTSTGNNIGL